MPGRAPVSVSRCAVVVLVEGASDRTALLTLVPRLGLGPPPDVTAMHGITNLPRHLGRLAAHEPVVLVHDAGESAYVSRALGRHPHRVSRHVCEADLEDELVRALGVPGALAVVHDAGDLAAWRTLCRQPFHRGRPPEQVLRRFLGTTSGRKDRYAGLLCAALDPDRAPRPLVAALGAAQ